jgi:hypothetical protein
MDKQHLYKTARATVSCAEFKAGDYVTVEYMDTVNGTEWYLIKATEHGPTSCVVAYAKHQLANFSL